jgi:hypothetical protein
MLLDVGNKDILDSGVGSIGGVAMGVWCKLVFLGGRGGVVPAVLVGFAVVLAASSSALAPSSKASSSPVVRGSSSVVIAVHGGIWFGCSTIDFGLSRSGSMSRPSVVVCQFGFNQNVSSVSVSRESRLRRHYSIRTVVVDRFGSVVR